MLLFATLLFRIVIKVIYISFCLHIKYERMRRQLFSNFLYPQSQIVSKS